MHRLATTANTNTDRMVRIMTKLVMAWKTYNDLKVSRQYTNWLGAHDCRSFGEIGGYLRATNWVDKLS